MVRDGCTNSSSMAFERKPIRDKSGVHLFLRNGKDFSEKFP
jgi:hypothetical protein